MTPKTARPRGNLLQAAVYETLNLPRVSVYYAAGTQGIAANTLTTVTWDTSEYDTDGMWKSSLPNVLTCRTAGLYQVEGAVVYQSDATASYRLLEIVKNNALATFVIYPPTVIAAPTNAGAGLQVAWQIPMVAGDTLTLFTQTGVALTVSASSASTRNNGFQATLISTI